MITGPGVYQAFVWGWHLALSGLRQNGPPVSIEFTNASRWTETIIGRIHTVKKTYSIRHTENRGPDHMNVVQDGRANNRAANHPH